MMVDWDLIAPMLVMVVLIVTTGGVMLLRPISKRFAELLEVMTQEKGSSDIDRQLGHITELLETTTQRLTLLEQRQDFSEALITEQQRTRKAIEGESKAG